MVLRLSTTFCVLVGAALVAQGVALKVTPIEKVVVLLKDLSSKIAAEGQKEAAQYDKFACFCKEQADEKNYAKKTSTEKIKYWTAERQQLQADMTALDNQVVDLQNNIEELEHKIEDKTEVRRGQHGEYLQSAQNMNEAIAACEAAIEQLKGSKKEMLSANIDLVQVTSKLVKVVKRQPRLATSPGAVTLLSKIDESGAPSYQFHSNDILAMVQDVYKTCNSMKKSLDEDEFYTKSDFDSTVLGLANEKTFAGKEKEEKVTISHAKEEQISELGDQIGEEGDDLKADGKFMKRLQDDCEDASTTFDQRSRLRGNELSTIEEATEQLQHGAVANYKANKALVGLQKSAVGKVGRRRSLGASPVTFVQIRNVQHQVSRDVAALQKVASFLIRSAEKSDSGALSAMAVRIGVVQRQKAAQGDVDHFVKVRGLLTDLIKKLQGDAESEATQKQACDEGIKAGTSSRDKANANIEAATGKLTVLNSNKEDIIESTQEAQKQISELHTAKLEAIELADQTIADSELQFDMCKDGVAAVEYALELLKSFYGDAAFVQFTPAGADREGNTMDDIMPARSTRNYHGAQAESKGIVGILEVILEDFKENQRSAEQDKKDTEDYREEFLKDTDADVRKKKNKVDTNDGLLSEMNEDILDQEKALKDANALLESGLKVLQSWHSMCVKGEETFEERAQKRKDEVEALKQAMDLLDDWQN